MIPGDKQMGSSREIIGFRKQGHIQLIPNREEQNPLTILSGCAAVWRQFVF